MLTQRHPIISIDANSAKMLRVAIDEALNAVAQEYGLKSISIGNINMDPHGTYFRTQLTATVKEENNPRAAAKHKSDSAMLGYSDSIMGRIITANGKKFKIIELMLNRPKYPVVAENLTDGKPYKFSAKHPFKFDGEAVPYDAAKNLFQY